MENYYMSKAYKRSRKRRSDYLDKTEKHSKLRWWMIPSTILVIAIIVFVVISLATAVDGRAIANIELIAWPEKLVYYIGDKPSYTGLELGITLYDGTEYIVGPEECEFSGFNSEFAEEEQHITVTYKEHTFSFTVTIKEVPHLISPLKKISLVTLPQTEYKVGDRLSVENGVLLLEYEDGHTQRIRLEYSHIYNFTTDKPGTHTISVKIMENGYLVTCTYQITVE